MKDIIKSRITKKFDGGSFGMCFVVGFFCVAGIAVINDELAASFLVAGLIGYPFIAAEKGFASFLLNGVLAEFIGVGFALLMALQKNMQGVSDFFIQYLGIVAITISMGVVGFLAYKLIITVSKKIKHADAN